jgi:RimJ/RimL family protein N-acetyltransferase
MNAKVTMETERLILRPWHADDYDAYARFYESDPLSRFSGGPMDSAVAWRHLASVIGHWTLRGYGVWAIEDRKTDILCGCAGAWRPQNWDRIEFAFWFTSEAFSRDLGAEGARRAFEEVCKTHPPSELVTYVPVEQHATQKIVESLGGEQRREFELADEGPHFAYHYT